MKLHVLKNVDSYFSYLSFISSFMIQANFEECTCSGVRKFKSQCSYLRFDNQPSIFVILHSPVILTFRDTTFSVFFASYRAGNGKEYREHGMKYQHLKPERI